MPLVILTYWAITVIRSKSGANAVALPNRMLLLPAFNGTVTVAGVAAGTLKLEPLSDSVVAEPPFTLILKERVPLTR